MKFEGRLTQFFPPDLLLFVASLNKEGVLTITDTETVLTITLKEARIIDAQSETADRKILKSLLVNKLLSEKNYSTITLAREQTRMPARQILESLNLLTNKTVKSIFLNGVKEVFFQFFKLKTGFFKFTELETGLSGTIVNLNPQAIAIEISQWADESTELENEFADLDRILSPATGPLPRNRQETIILSDIGNGLSVADLAKKSPFPSFPTLKLVKQMVDRQILTLHDLSLNRIAADPDITGSPVFTEFRNAARQILAASTITDKVKGMLRFCSTFFDDFFILSLNRQEIVHLIHYSKDHNRALRKTHRKHISKALASEPVFLKIYESGISFFGNFFPTDLMAELEGVINKNECAVIPYQKTKTAMNILYVISGEHGNGESPLNYLEVLSWMVAPGFAGQDRAPGTGLPGSSQGITGLPPSPDKLRQMADTVSELPPMPPVTSKVLSLLSNPDYDQQALANLISMDPSIMASLLKVSNSALYRAAEKITTVNEAVKRLGPKVIKSIIIAASTRSLFPGGDSDFRLLSNPLWLHSKECAVIARRIAMESNVSDPEEIFVGGLLHDIGKLAILMKNTDDYRRLQNSNTLSGQAGLEAERIALGYTHSDVGEMLMNQWNMPEELLLHVKHHHDISDNCPDHLLPVAIVTVANYLAHALHEDKGSGLLNTPDFIISRLDALKLQGDRLTAMMELITRDLEQTHVFDT